jgi:hypothetical protein
VHGHDATQLMGEMWNYAIIVLGMISYAAWRYTHSLLLLRPLRRRPISISVSSSLLRTRIYIVPQVAN